MNSLVKEAIKARQKAYIPLFQIWGVGAAILLKDGKVIPWG